MATESDTTVVQSLVAAVTAALQSATEKQTSMLSSFLSEMVNAQKGAVNTQGTFVREDVNGTEAIQHASAMIPLNAKFWFDICATQATLANAELTKSLAQWDKLAQRTAVNALTADHKDQLSSGPLAGKG